MEEELQTDSSMRGIDYNDIKSDQSDFGEENKSESSNEDQPKD